MGIMRTHDRPNCVTSLRERMVAQALLALDRQFAESEGSHSMSETDLIEENFFSVIEPRLDEFVDRYYDRLFSHYPELKPLFRSPPAKQKEHFAWSLRLVVANLRNPGALESLLLTLGGAHAGYGVERRHFSQVGESLVGSLREMSGCAWRPELEHAWERAYASIIKHFYVHVGGSPAVASSSAEVDLFKLAEEYLGLARRRRAMGKLSVAEAERSTDLRDLLDAQLSGPAPGFVSRRCDLRVPDRSLVEFHSRSRDGVGHLTTVGERGVFIATECLVDPGESVEIRVYREPREREADPITASGTVVWQRAARNPAGPPGIALQFEKTSGGILDLLERGLFVSLGLGPRTEDEADLDPTSDLEI